MLYLGNTIMRIIMTITRRETQRLDTDQMAKIQVKLCQ